MTMTVQSTYDAYRNGADGDFTNHDGTFEMPEKVTDLGPKQFNRWQNVANYGNEHANARVKNATAGARATIEEMTTQINNLKGQLEETRQRMKGFEGDAQHWHRRYQELEARAA